MLKKDSILFLIEEAIQKKDYNSFSKLSNKLGIDITQTQLFVKYFNKFEILSSLLDTKYTNYFNKICLTELREKDILTVENFAKAIIIFIKERRKGKKLYHINLQNNNDIKIEILILSQLDYKSLVFTISVDENVNLKDNLNIFSYINYIDEYYTIKPLNNYLIENQIDSPAIYNINLSETSIDKILSYSKKYPNRIKNLELYTNEFNDYDKLKEILELNKDSLISYPHINLKYLIPLKNAHIINISQLNEEFDKSFDFSKITIIDSISCYDDGDNQIIHLLNRCPNVEQISFCESPSENFLKILENINCPKIKEIYATCEDLERDYDWTKIFERMPLLENIFIEEHQTMCWAYDISPVFTAENKRLAFPLLEQLIRNYLNGSEDRDIHLQFDDEFNEFWDYFKDKKDIISRVSKLNGEDVTMSLESYFKTIINKYDTVDNIPDAKYYYCFIETPFDESALEFVKRNKVEYLFILHGGNINFDELKKCQDLKFVFDKYSKEFYFKNKESKCIEKM